MRLIVSSVCLAIAVTIAGTLAFQPKLKSAPAHPKKVSLISATPDEISDKMHAWMKKRMIGDTSGIDMKTVYNERLTCNAVKVLGSYVHLTDMDKNPKQLIIVKSDKGMPFRYRVPLGNTDVPAKPFKYMAFVVDLNTGVVSEESGSSDGSMFKAILKDSSVPDEKKNNELKPGEKEAVVRGHGNAQDLTPTCQ